MEVGQLKHIIQNSLFDIIDSDFVLLDLPYYENIGDALIWQGTEDFLKTFPYKCLYRASIETYTKPSISSEVIIILQGGGNFGDIWRRHTDFFLRVLEEFPLNKVLMLPQTVYYRSLEQMKMDAAIIARHNNVTICARDHVTFNILGVHLNSVKLLLVPDMAFFIDDKKLLKGCRGKGNGALFVLRNDQELLDRGYEDVPKGSGDLAVGDWPTYEKMFLADRILRFLKRWHRKSRGKASAFFLNFYAKNFYLPFMVKTGVNFISPFNTVSTTRLHGGILSVLLQRTTIFYDNSYGKNKQFFDSWLTNSSNVSFRP